MVNENQLSVINRYEKEFSVDSEGRGYVTQRGLARLCGVSHRSWGRGGSFFTVEIDETLAGYGLEGGSIKRSNTDSTVEFKIPDTIATIVIKHYAYKGKKEAQQIDMVIGAVGLRTLIQQACGHTTVAKRSLTSEEIIELCCLPVATDWERRFPVEYYEQLERLTGLKAEEHKRPAYWAKLTKELVYDHLPAPIYLNIKKCKAETGSFEKLHQFLSEDGIRLLESHQRSLLVLMQSASSICELKRLIEQSRTKTYQLWVF